MNKLLIIPTECPYCGEPTTIGVSDTGVQTLYCGNSTCEGKLQNRIDHYLGKKGLDVKGISKSTIEKLIDWGWINELKDIYKLNEHRAEWESKTGFGKASVSKILNAIDAEGRHPKLESFISGLGIPLVGLTVAKEIVKYYPTWNDFIDALGGHWIEFDGFGPELDYNLNHFDYTEAMEIAAMLDFEQPKTQNSEEQTKTAAGLTFCVTGKLNSGNWKNRNELKNYIESIGGKVVSSMSSKVDYLINNDSTSSSAKNLAAKKNGTPIITEKEFIEKWL